MAASCTASCSLAFGFAAPARANLVLNGGFELSTIVGSFDSSFLNGNQAVELNDWLVSNSFSFISDKASAQSNLNESDNGPDPVFGTPIPLTRVWGPDSGSNNGFSGPPGSADDNKFVVSNGAYGASATFTQNVQGFEIGKQYVLSYKYAGAQQEGFYGDSVALWQAKLGNYTFDSLGMNVPSQGFFDWVTYTSDPFTASATSLVLEFVADGAPSGQSPFSLLDDVQIVEYGAPPTDAVPGPLPALGVGMTLAWARKLRRRMAAAAEGES